MPQRERYESRYSGNKEIEQKITNTRKPNIGDIWYTKIKNSIGVSTMRIQDLTENTVVLINLDFNTSWSDGTRYALSDIEFIEKAK